jgi:hypothetical protein
MSLSEYQQAYRNLIWQYRIGEYGYCKCNRPGHDREWPNHCRICKRPWKEVYLNAKRKGGNANGLVEVRSVVGNTVYFSGSEHLDSADISCFLLLDDEVVEIGGEYDLFYNFITPPRLYLHREEGDEFSWLDDQLNNSDE